MINKALVINDDAISRMVACKMISKAGFANETVIACDGRAGLAYFDRYTEAGSANADEIPEFIFLDLNMPVMNGWDFLEIFSRRHAMNFPDVKVAVMSAYINEADREKLQQYQMVVGCVNLPISLGTLSEIKEKLARLNLFAA